MHTVDVNTWAIATLKPDSVHWLESLKEKNVFAFSFAQVLGGENAAKLLERVLSSQTSSQFAGESFFAFETSQVEGDYLVSLGFFVLQMPT